MPIRSNTCVMPTYELPILMSALSKNENKMVIREDRMLIKVLHQEKGYTVKEVSSWFPNKAFEL